MGAKNGPKGKKSGGGCPKGEIAVCLQEGLFDEVKTAFYNGVKSKGGTDACLAGSIRVCLKPVTANFLVAGLLAGLAGTTTKKKKKNKNKKGKK